MTQMSNLLTCKKSCQLVKYSFHWGKRNYWLVTWLTTENLHLLFIHQYSVHLFQVGKTTATPLFWSTARCWSYRAGSQSTSIMWRRGDRHCVSRGVWACSPQCFRDRGGDGEAGKDRKKRAACAIIYVPLQRKMQSQLHKHHASTEWQRVLYTESLCSREGAREVERE